MPSLASAITYFGVYPMWDEGTMENIKTYGRSTAVRTMLCKWTDRITLANNIFALSGVNLSQQPYYQEAAPYPDAPYLLFFDTFNSEGAFGSNAEVGVGVTQQLYIGSNGLVSYPYCRVRLTYASRPWDLSTLQVTNLDFGIEEVSLPSGSFFWVSDNTPVPQVAVPSLRVISCTISVTQYNQPSIPFAILTSYVGKVNSTPIFGLPAGTVLLGSPKSSQRITVAGTVNVDVTYPFTWLSVGWQKKFRPGMGFQAIQDSSSQPPFQTANLNGVLTGIIV